MAAFDAAELVVGLLPSVDGHADPQASTIQGFQDFGCDFNRFGGHTVRGYPKSAAGEVMVDGRDYLGQVSPNVGLSAGELDRPYVLEEVLVGLEEALDLVYAHLALFWFLHPPYVAGLAAAVAPVGHREVGDRRRSRGVCSIPRGCVRRTSCTGLDN